MTGEFESEISEANKLYDAGELESAKKIYLGLAEKHPQSLRVSAGLGLVYYNLGLWNEALVVFRRAVELFPSEEAISKGVFLSLWNLDRIDESLEEIKRFQSISESEDYTEIMREIKEKW